MIQNILYGVIIVPVLGLYGLIGYIDRGGIQIWETVCEVDGQEYTVQYYSKFPLSYDEEIRMCKYQWNY